MSLNANAKPFVFSTTAKPFVMPGAEEPAPAPAAAAPPAEESVKENWDDPEAESDPVAEATAALDAMAVEEEEAPAPEEKKEEVKEEVSTVITSKSSKKKAAEQASYKVHDTREHLNIVFIGHVDAGKSTIAGQILLLTDQVDKRTIEKYEKEAKEKNRESWYLAYVMDTSEEERNKGKTVEVGRAHFTTDNKRYTLLDAPGHKNYVPNMIGGAAQADVGILVISARKGEFETGFDRGGQTREHAMLAKTLGIQRLIVLVNKMDDSTVKWSKSRFDQIEGKLSPFLKKWGYNIKRDVTYCPCSGLTGANLRDPVAESVAPWYKETKAAGASMFQLLDAMKALKRDDKGAVRMPIIGRYKEMGTLCLLGKLECGTLRKGDDLVIMPTGRKIECLGINIEEEEIDMAVPGENLIVKVKGVEEDEIAGGYVICGPERLAPLTKKFLAQVAILDLLEHKPLVTAGYAAVLHIHSLVIECTIKKLTAKLDRKTGKKSTSPPKFCKSGDICDLIILLDSTVAVETFASVPQMGRFTLRDEGKTIGIGKVLKIQEHTK